MAEATHEYEVLIGGLPHTLLLSASDAERYGDSATRVVRSKAVTPANKAAGTYTK